MYNKYDLEALNQLVGATVKQIFMNENLLRFITDKGSCTFRVTGDCCSQSYFYDFIGVDKLLKNGAIKLIESILLDEPQDIDAAKGEVVKAYGFRFITEDLEFGEVSSVMSFRNDSNGYYGGSLENVLDQEVSPEIIQDSTVRL